MNPNDHRLHPALLAAIGRIKATAAAAADRAVDGLGISALSAVGMRQRDAFLAAQYEFGRRAAAFKDRFNIVLTERVTHELAPRGAASARGAPPTNWQSLSLVQEDEVDELVSSERLGQTIAHECEWELRELATYMGSVLRTGRAEQDKSPLRPEIIGRALFRAIEAVSTERDTRALLTRELGRSLAQSMRNCYREIITDMQSRGIQPVGLTVKGVEGPGNELPRETLRQNSAYDTLARDSGGQNSRFDSRYDLGTGPQMLGPPSSARSLGHSTQGTGGSGPASLRGSDWRHGRSTSGHGGSGHGTPMGSVDSQMMALIRRLAFLGSRLGDADSGNPADPASGGGGGGGGGGSGSGGGGGGGRLHAGGGHGAGSHHGMPLPELMAANLIRQHREELRQAATGALDHMVIDVVGSLFDQILSDPKVPPQMARQIARLQLPVLRVALGDVTFFSSRRHPVRRFVNRIASLACAFEDFTENPGLEFLARVRDLVQEIVEGDFDQMEVYESKLNALESYIAGQNEQTVEDQGATASLLNSKETELRLQQRYMQTLNAGLAALSIPDFIREFLAQVWSQTIMRAVHSDGAKSDAAKRFRLAGRELVMSVQPKGSPTHRKNFLIKLPQLMKDLNDGLNQIGWPEIAKKGFFAALLPAHAESLKGQPLTDLSYNLLASEIDSILGRSVPRSEDLARSDPIPELNDVVLDNRFSTEEAERIGLVAETAVDWDGKVDIEVETAAERAEAAEAANVDVNIDGLPPATDAPEPNQGAALMDHVQIGFAYQMHLNQGWQKVRLSYVSPGRAFFVFTRGKKQQETISLTARMLARLCETDRLRPYESAYLLERATVRARKQLAALKPATSRQ